MVKGWLARFFPLGKMTEVDLAADLGVGRETLKEIRKRILKVGDDYKHGQHKRVEYLPSGIRKVSQEIFPDDYEVVVEEPEVIEGKVTNWKFRNHKIVEVDGDRLVRVKDAKLYMPNGRGELCPIRYKKNLNGWIVDGPAPRRPGFWK